MRRPILSPLFKANIKGRHLVESIWRAVFRSSTVIGIVFLSLLLFNIINQSFGYIAIETRINPDSLSVNGVSLERLVRTGIKGNPGEKCINW